MKKLNSLRQHLENAIPALQQNPDQMLIFADTGALRSTSAQGLSFEYSYTLNLILTNYAGDLSAIAIPLFDWVRVNQSELMANLSKVQEGIKFEVDVLNNDLVDVAIYVPLTERVIVKRGTDGALNIEYPDEPQYTAYEPATAVTLYDPAGATLAQWTSVDKPDAYALEMPHPVPPQNR